MTSRDPLDDPDYAAFAWTRFRRILAIVAGVGAVAAIAAAAWIGRQTGVTIHGVLATALGVFGSVLLAGALMGLVFLSAGSGHDEHIGRGD